MRVRPPLPAAAVDADQDTMAGGREPAERSARLRALFTTMARIRAFEDAAEIASQGGVAAWGLQAAGTPAKVRGPLHLSTGQEAVAAGVCANLRRDDLLTSTHRGHGHTLAKGADMTAMMCELFGRASGCNGGKGGSMHIADFAVGMLGANGVVAAGIPIATGAAHALKIQRALQPNDRIVACFFGDGATNRGPFLEGLNWAQVYRLPVLFVCEDNRIAATTETRAMTAGDGAAARARALGIHAETIDGNDVETVDAAAAGLVARVRGGGPALLHAVTYRFKGHVSVDPGRYRDPAEVERALADDPLARARAQLAALGAADDAARIEVAARAEVRAALAAAEAAPYPPASAAYTDVLDTAQVWR
jgi:acetoin:2,6-dichlorophenolindophenol oxidoreductase subunit alpha